MNKPAFAVTVAHAVLAAAATGATFVVLNFALVVA